MNGQAHQNIMTGAFDALPDALRQPLELLRPLLEQVPNYPDYFDDPTRPVADKRRIDPEWESYCVFPEGMEGPCLHRWPHPKTQQSKWRPMVEYWARRALESLHRGHHAAYLKFTGCLSHLLGDVTQPAHLMDLALLQQLMPAPEEMPDFHYHTDFEAVTGECGTLRPARLMGTSVAEMSWRVAARNRRDMVECRSYIVPTLEALFCGDTTEATRLAGPPVTLAAQSTLDLMYTTLRLASGAIGPEEQRDLDSVDLRTWQADAQFHDSVYGGAILDGNRSTPPSGAPIIPALLRNADGSIRPAKGLGMLPHSGMAGPRHAWMKFDLPEGVFSTFEATVGMNAAITREGAAEFVVELDGAEVFRSGARSVNEPAVAVRVGLGAAKELTLKVRDVNEGRTFWNNHAFWAEPSLVKSIHNEIHDIYRQDVPAGAGRRRDPATIT